MSDTSSIRVNDVVTTIVFFTKELVKNKKTYNELKSEYDTYNRKLESNIRWQNETDRYYENKKFDKRVECWPTFIPAPMITLNEENTSYRNKIKEIKPKLELAKLDYEKQLKIIDSIFNNINIYKIIEVANYLDIEINQIDKDKIVSQIKKSIISDFEILLTEENFYDDLKYMGTVSIIKKLICKTIDCFLIIKNCNYYNERMSKLQAEREDTEYLLKLQNEKYENLENSLLNKIFKRKELQKISWELKRLHKLNSDLIYEMYVIKDTVETLPKKKIILCNKFLISITHVNQLIDKLGEKSLKELIEKLKINITSTDDNYFDEKAEMKKALKQWFDAKIKKIENEVNADSESVSNSKQKAVRDGVFNRGDLFGK